MNKIFIYCVLGFLCISQSLTANNVPAIFSINDRYTDEEIAQQISELSSEMDLKYTEEVKKLINIYISSGRPGSELILSKSNYYFPIMESIISKHNVPDEIKYLSVIESGLRPKIRSKAGAVGLWQFIGSTAKMYKLRIGSTLDDRQDVAKSTEAALQYLTDLHERFGDWGLALAAYNCGPGNINKAIRKAGGKKSYWELKKYLPKETRRYLPKFVATMYIMEYFEHYGLKNDLNKYTEHSSFGLATVYKKISFKELSNLSGLSIKELKKYNPSYKQYYIPSSKSGNTLIMPEAYLFTFLQNTSTLDQLVDVFYLKNTLFTLPKANVGQEDIQSIDNTRIAINVDFLMSSIEPLNVNQKTGIPKAFNFAPNLSGSVSKDLVRLKKRQTMKDVIKNSNLRRDQLHMVNVSGFVSQ